MTLRAAGRKRINHVAAACLVIAGVIGGLLWCAQRSGSSGRTGEAGDQHERAHRRGSDTKLDAEEWAVRIMAEQSSGHAVRATVAERMALARHVIERRGVVIPGVEMALASVAGTTGPELASVIAVMLAERHGWPPDRSEEIGYFVVWRPQVLANPIMLIAAVGYARMMGNCQLSRDLVNLAMRRGCWAPCGPAVVWLLSGWCRDARFRGIRMGVPATEDWDAVISWPGNSMRVQFVGCPVRGVVTEGKEGAAGASRFQILLRGEALRDLVDAVERHGRVLLAWNGMAIASLQSDNVSHLKSRGKDFYGRGNDGTLLVDCEHPGLRGDLMIDILREIAAPDSRESERAK